MGDKFIPNVRNTTAFVIRSLRKIVLPGFDGLPLFSVLQFFFKGLFEGRLTLRASAISFDFFLALFPSILFFFTIIPFIPIAGFQPELLLTLEDIPGKITETVLSTISSPVVFLLALNALLLVVGMFMDIISATMILGPVFLPMLDAFNVDWMHFGLILTVNLAIGYCTPPMGVSLYITGAIANRDLIYVSKAVLPFILIQLCVLLFITYFPEAVLWLPRVMGFSG